MLLLIAHRQCEINVGFKVKGEGTNTREICSKKNGVGEAVNVPILPVFIKPIKHELEETVHNSVEKKYNF